MILGAEIQHLSVQDNVRGDHTWLRNLVVKEMPNLVGVMAMPRLRKRLRSLKSSIALCLSSRPPADSIALSQHVRCCIGILA